MSTEHWIKVRKGIYDSPKMRAVSFKCKCSTSDAFLGWFKLYCYFDSHTEDGKVEFFSKADVDSISGIAGMGQALVEVKWLTFIGNNCVVEEWAKHNGNSAKHRLLQSERQVKSRNNRGLQNA